jgi:MFS family permease
MTRRWLPAWGLAAVAFGGGSLIVPLYVVELGGDAFVLGLLFATSSFVGVPGALAFGLYLVLNAGAAAFYGRVAGLTGARKVTTVQAGGLLARGLAFPLVLLVGAVVGRTLLGTGAILLVFALIGVTWAVTAVTAATIVTRLAPPVIRGEALGVYGALVALAGGLGGLVGGSLGATSYPLTFGTACGLVVVGAALVFLVGRKAPVA